MRYIRVVHHSFTQLESRMSLITSKWSDEQCELCDSAHSNSHPSEEGSKETVPVLLYSTCFFLSFIGIWNHTHQVLISHLTLGEMPMSVAFNSLFTDVPPFFWIQGPVIFGYFKSDIKWFLERWIVEWSTFAKLELPWTRSISPISSLRPILMNNNRIFAGNFVQAPTTWTSVQ